MLTPRITPGIAQAPQTGFSQRIDVLLLGQVQDQPDTLVVLDGAVMKHPADVEDAQTTHFQQIAQGRRTSAFQQIGRDPGQIRAVVGNQEMTTADQLQRQFLLPMPLPPVIRTPIPNTSSSSPWTTVGHPGCAGRYRAAPTPPLASRGGMPERDTHRICSFQDNILALNFFKVIVMKCYVYLM